VTEIKRSTFDIEEVVIAKGISSCIGMITVDRAVLDIELVFPICTRPKG
jgi:hypothetical protein